MREIKFRAKRLYDKEWIYGFLLNVDGSFHLIQKDDMREDVYTVIVFSHFNPRKSVTSSWIISEI